MKILIGLAASALIAVPGSQFVIEAAKGSAMQSYCSDTITALYDSATETAEFPATADDFLAAEPDFWSKMGTKAPLVSYWVAGDRMGAGFTLADAKTGEQISGGTDSGCEVPDAVQKATDLVDSLGQA